MSSTSIDGKREILMRTPTTLPFGCRVARRRILGLPDLISNRWDAVPDIVVHGVFPHAAEERVDFRIFARALLDAVDIVGAVVSEQVFERAGGERGCGRRVDLNCAPATVVKGALRSHLEFRV